MTQAELINALKAHYFIVFNPREIETENDIVSYRIPVFTLRNECLIRQWVQYYVNDKDEAFWSDRNPIPITTITPEQTKVLELQKIKTEAKEMSDLVKIGLEPQTALDDIKVKYDALKIK